MPTQRRTSRVDPGLLSFAKAMRHSPAPAERKIWRCLRDRKLNGLKFRRQYPVDRFIADFYCAEFRLIVEADGQSHALREAYDADRTSRLNELGYSVVRYSNVDVHENIEGVLLAILDATMATSSTPEPFCPSPQPSPLFTREREQTRRRPIVLERADGPVTNGKYKS